MASAESQFGYQPALDGLRGVAVLAVLLFHGGFSWMSGGYVGVSVFFTLSGFLITSLLILEHQRSGRVSWSAFVARRAKRLLPASLLCLVAISLLAWSGEFAGVPHLRRDITSAAFQVANWNALHGSGSYADLLSRSAGVSSPVDHFWSLAVEEQFYWVWPLAFLLVMRVSKTRAKLFRNLSLLALVGVVAARVIALRWGADAAYWATPARLGEILVGAALAGGCLLWHRRPRWLGWVGLAGLGAIVWAAIMWPTRGGPAYAGWFGVFSLASAALILGLQAPGVLRRLFSTTPLVWLGRISYGVYVFHWPVYLLVWRRTVHLDGLPLFGLRLAITLVAAMLSYWLLERPVRLSRPAPHLAMSVALPVLAAVVVFAAIVVPAQVNHRAVAAPAPTTTVPAIADELTADSIVAQVLAPAASTTLVPTAIVPATIVPTTMPAPDGPIDVLLIGDSTAQALDDGLRAWAGENPVRTVDSVARMGCGLIRGTTMKGDEGGSFVKQCGKVLARDLPAALAAHVPDVAVILVTVPDVAMRQWNGDEGMLRPTDDRYHQRLLADYRLTAQLLIDAGVRHIAWVVPPPPAEWWLGWISDVYAPQSWQLLSSAIVQIGAEYPGVVEVVRLDQWFVDSGAASDGTIRDDGLHLTGAGAQTVMDQFLGPVLLRLVAV